MLLEPLFAHAKNQPNEIAVIDDAGRYSYQQVAATTVALAGLIDRLTDKPTVGLLLPAGAAFVVSFYGTLLARKTVVPINFLLGEAELIHVVKDSGVDMILTITPLASKFAGSGLNIIDLMQLPRPSAEDAAQMPIDPKIEHKPDDLAVLMYTSGTSALPKGVCLTFNNLQSDVDAAIDKAKLEHRHKFLGVIPLFHAFGMTAMMLAPIQLGSTIIYIARFSPVAVLNAMREHRASIMFGVPSMFAAIANLKSALPDDFSSGHALITGGEPQPATLREKFLERFNALLLEGYGLTETSPVVALNVPQSHRDGSVGQLIRGATARITGDDGQEVPIGDTGEIWLKGPMIMRGYHNLPEATAAALTPDGHFRTGDLGRLDEDGFLYITGRIKDLIIVAGEKAVPREIEDILARHPSVADAAVLGKKDASRGEVVVAFVTAKAGETINADELRDACRAAGLPQWKIPRQITVLEDLPRSPTGKVLKRILAELLKTDPQ